LSSKPETALGALLRLYFDIAIWRRGPADVPAVPILLWLTVAAYAALTALLSATLQLRGSWPYELAVDVAFMLGWVWLLLWAAGRSERWLQTATALFGFQLIVAPLLIAVDALAPEHPVAGDAQLLAVQLATLLLVAWIVVATAHIVSAAFEWPLAAGVALAIFLVVTEQLLLRTLLYTEAA
jgi:hypothetical protein